MSVCVRVERERAGRRETVCVFVCVCVREKECVTDDLDPDLNPLPALALVGPEFVFTGSPSFVTPT